MATIVQMPRLSDTMREGVVARWLKAVGQSVEAGEALAEIETDKAVMTFESFDEGVLLGLVLPEGEAVALGTPMAVLGDKGEDVSALIPELEAQVAAAIAAAGEGAADAASAPSAPEAPSTPTAPPPRPSTIAQALPASSPATEHAGPAPVDDEGVRLKVTPLARRLAAERGIDLGTVAGSGPHGRIILRDLEGLDATRRVRAPSSRPVPPAESVRVTQMRKTIAGRLVEAKQGAPHFYLTITADAAPLVALRRELNEVQDEARISYNDLIHRAVVLALLEHPEVNAGWEGATIRRYGSVHLGFAVAMPDGLITPVMASAERHDVVGLSRAARALARRARAGELQPEEYSGNSFCVSNLGMLGIEHFTAIINPPAACILAVGALRPQPVVREGAVVAGQVMSMTLSCDHRVVDGAMGAEFLKTVRRLLERPLALVL